MHNAINDGTWTREEISRRIFVALDVSSMPDALKLVHQVREYVGGFKVGLEICTAFGVPQVVEAISAAGGDVFLDLKFKDIPTTVARALRAVANSCTDSVRMLTLHCDGGDAMLQSTVTSRHDLYWSGQPPLLLGVTVLTSMNTDALHRVGVAGALDEHVVRLAQLARHAGLDGVVASPHEVAAIKQACGVDFLTVTPGVRPTWAAAGDQQRVMTPADALLAGADYLVIGRPITAAPIEQGGPVVAAQRIVEETLESLNP